MATSGRRARAVSLSKLSSSIDQAIELAAKRYEISAESPNVLGRGDIIGRLVEGADIKEAFAFAEAVTARVNKLPGIDAVPTLSRLGRGILMGFWDRGQTLRQLGGE
jgi:hypothetical protein